MHGPGQDMCFLTQPSNVLNFKEKLKTSAFAILHVDPSIGFSPDKWRKSQGKVEKSYSLVYT